MKFLNEKIAPRKFMFFIFSILLFNSYAFGQVDSLIINFYQEKSSEERMKIAYKIGVKYLRSSPDTSVKYSSLALKDSVNVQANVLTGNCLNVLSISYYYLGKHSKSAHSAKKAIAQFKSAGDELGIAKAHKNYAIALNGLGQFAKSVSANLLALDYFESVSDTFGITGTYNDIGNTLITLNNYDEALHYLSEGLKYLENSRNPRLQSVKGNILNSKGIIYKEQGMSDSAIYFYEQSLNVKEPLGNPYSTANTKNNLCTCIDYKKETKKSINCFIELIVIQRKIKNYEGIVRSNINLSIAYNELGLCKKSLSVLDSALVLEPLIADKELLAELYRKYSFTLFKCGKYKEAYVSRKKYELFNDSLFSMEKQQTILDLNEKYQSEQKEEAINRLKIRSELDRVIIQRQKLLLASVISFSLLVLGVLYFLFSQYKKRQKRRRMQEIWNQKETERSRIARDMHDEIGAGLTRIVMLGEQVKVRLQSVNELNNDISESFGKISTEARGLSYNLSEIIWALNPGNDSFDTLCAYIRSYTYDYLEDANISCNISFPDNIPTITILPEQRREIFLMIKEILNNIVKHSKSTEVELALRVFEQSFSMKIKDDGSGIDGDKLKAGNGLNNLERRTTKLGGSFSIQSNLGEGTTIFLERIPFTKNPTKV